MKKAFNHTSREIGAFGEEVVSRYLALRGYKILCRNYTVKGGELDIVARRFGTLVFVEVKTRDDKNTAVFGDPSSAVDEKKRQHIKLAAKRYLSEHRPSYKLIRMDVAEVYISGSRHKINYIKTAF